jgi:hypothetical protein
MGKAKPDDLAASLPGEKAAYWRDEQRKIEGYFPSTLERELPRLDKVGGEATGHGDSLVDSNPDKGVISYGNEHSSRTVVFEGDRKDGRWVEDRALKTEHGVRETVEATVFTEQSIELFQQSVDSNGGRARGHYIHLDKADPEQSFMVTFGEEWLLGEKHSTTVSASKTGAWSDETKFADQAKENLENLAAKAARWDQGGHDSDARVGAVSVSDKALHASLSDHLETLSYGMDGSLTESLDGFGKVFGHILGPKDRINGAAEMAADGSLQSMSMKRSSPDGKAKGDYFFEQRDDGSKIYAAPDHAGRQRIVKEEPNGTLYLATTDQDVAGFLQKDDWSITGF